MLSTGALFAPLWSEVASLPAAVPDWSDAAAPVWSAEAALPVEGVPVALASLPLWALVAAPDVEPAAAPDCEASVLELSVVEIG